MNKIKKFFRFIKLINLLITLINRQHGQIDFHARTKGYTLSKIDEAHRQWMSSIDDEILTIKKKIYNMGYKGSTAKYISIYILSLAVTALSILIGIICYCY